MTIWKFPLKLTDVQTVLTPKGTMPLSVAIQNKELCLWATVTPGPLVENVTVFIVGTGLAIPEDANIFIGTVVEPTCPEFVWHVWTKHPWSGKEDV